MRQVLTDYFGVLHKYMNCAFPLTRCKTNTRVTAVRYQILNFHFLQSLISTNPSIAFVRLSASVVVDQILVLVDKNVDQNDISLTAFVSGI